MIRLITMIALVILEGCASFPECSRLPCEISVMDWSGVGKP